MITRTPRFLLAFCSLLMLAGGLMHATAFKLTVSAVSTSNLTPFFGNSFKALWLGDSTTMFVLAVIFGLIAARPSVATRPLLCLIALIPATTAVLLYVFLGGFFAGHILMLTAVLAFVAGLQFPAGKL